MNQLQTDYSTTSLPLSERRSPLIMGLLWITMVTAFPTVLVGFEWYKNGFTLGQVAISVVVSCLLLIAYSIPAAQLGARSGLNCTAFSRCVFGRWGSRLVSVNLIWIFVSFYGLTALLMAQSLLSLFHWTISVAALSAIIAVLMS